MKEIWPFDKSVTASRRSMPEASRACGNAKVSSKVANLEIPKQIRVLKVECEA